MSIIPTLIDGWLTTPCPVCAKVVRSSASHNLPSALKRHVTRYHKDTPVSDGTQRSALTSNQSTSQLVTSEPTTKTIHISRTYYSGSGKRLRALYPPLIRARVRADFPRASGCAVVTQSGQVKIYPKLGAGEMSWEIV